MQITTPSQVAGMQASDSTDCWGCRSDGTLQGMEWATLLVQVSRPNHRMQIHHPHLRAHLGIVFWVCVHVILD
jgi:hypothetical protein